MPRPTETAKCLIALIFIFFRFLHDFQQLLMPKGYASLAFPLPFDRCRVGFCMVVGNLLQHGMCGKVTKKCGKACINGGKDVKSDVEKAWVINSGFSFKRRGRWSGDNSRSYDCTFHRLLSTKAWNVKC